MDMNQLIRIFCEIDDFCKEFDRDMRDHLLPNPSCRQRGPRCSLSDSEIMTLLIAFQFSGFRNFKNFYTGFVAIYWKDAFPNLPSYNRFIELISRVIFPLVIFTQMHTGKKTGIYYIDSTCLPVCHLKRSSRHKTFKEISKYGKTSVGWFFGFKLHLVINDQGQLIAFKITSGNHSDIKAAEPLFKGLKGLSFGDKGYLGKEIFQKLLQKGLKLITRVRKNMKAPLLSNLEKQLLNQRNIIETVIGHIKHRYQVWHTRHRSLINAMTHLVAALAAYTIEPLKISAIKMIQNKTIINPNKTIINPANLLPKTPN